MINPILKFFTGITYQVPRIASSTFELITMGTWLHAIHDGDAYTVSQRTAVDAFDIADPMSFYIITPNSARHSHLAVLPEANAPGYWEIFEDTGDLSEFNVSGGSSVTPKNKNRNCPDASTLVITSGPTITNATAAALLTTEAVGKSGGSGPDLGFILKQNTKYLVRASTYGDNNEGSLKLWWHEHVDLEEGG